MADDAALRSRRAKRHKRGDHTLCRPERCPHAPSAEVVEFPNAASASASSLSESYRARLDEVDRLDTPEGQTVMALVRMLEAGGHSASGAAALSRELRSAADVALKGVAVKGDKLDELAERRRMRQAGP